MSTCEACGWAAAMVSALAFGSFGVPIKSKAAVQVDVDPLVFQSYKTFMCFATAWLVLAFGQPWTFTPWGIVSGLFWVPGGVATVYAVKNAGLAIGVGIGSSCIVLVSFIWGIFIFGEPVQSRAGACLAVAAIMGGIMGMSYYSSPESTVASPQRLETDPADLVGDDHHEDDDVNDISNPCHHAFPQRYGYNTNTRRSEPQFCAGHAPDYLVLAAHEDKDADDGGDSSPTSFPEQATAPAWPKRPPSHQTDSTASPSFFSDSSADHNSEIVVIVDGADDDEHFEDIEEPAYEICGFILTKRRRGMMAAAFCGLWGGSIMAPMKFCKSNTKGTAYLLSFAIGASIVTCSFWFLRFCYNAGYCQSVSLGYSSLPSFHIRTLWLAGGTSGLVWSIGNFFSLLSVYYLGEGVGYPLVQTAILFNGLWGIFYLKEITGFERISKWICSSLLTVFGILLLSYEHHHA